ncbi:MAG: acyl-ACP--UDP-N-acetylglucosamine O-acyltransferase [bacterium]|nr:acyl-ACP--UDP-N-acetylglucosamine O-acyltransferase [bacterium]MBK8130308.1 acyl-ACP--UDP-N-acetylglucosamine O-acyltransferase [bacterium]
MPKIHPQAIVSPKALVADDVIIEAFAVIDDNVEIGSGTTIGSSTRLFAGTHIGKNVRISPMVAIGGEPQDKKFSGEPTNVFIGDDTQIREFVTVSRGTAATGKTTVGSNCLIMAYAHIAHDCAVGDNVILANCVQLAGHVHVDDYAILGGMVPVHQFVHIGRHCMIGGGFRVPKDVPPYVLATGHPLAYTGLNVIGLRRRGYTTDQIRMLKQLYFALFQSAMNVSQALEEIADVHGDDPFAQEILEFVRISKRGLMPGPARRHEPEDMD